MHIVFVGQSGIPFAKTATVNRINSFCSTLQCRNVLVSVVNRRFSDKNGQSGKYSIYNVFTTKPSGYLCKLIRLVLSFPKEFFLIRRIQSQIKIDALVVYSQYFFVVLFYSIVAKSLHIKLILQYVEYRSAMPKRGIFKFNDHLFDKFSFYFVDAVIPISYYLENIVLNKTPTKPALRIPPICDYALFESIQAEKRFHFVYCASSAYLDVISFVIEAFLGARIDNKYTLKLIISGDFEKVKKLVRDSRIEVLSGLGYAELITAYKESSGLIIPLRDTIQDIARFPHKLSEYAASKSVIISSSVGEVSAVFTNMYNALLCEKYESKDFSKALEYIVSNPKDANEIASRSLELGKRFFDENIYGDKIINFINSLK